MVGTVRSHPKCITQTSLYNMQCRPGGRSVLLSLLEAFSPLQGQILTLMPGFGYHQPDRLSLQPNRGLGGEGCGVYTGRSNDSAGFAGSVGDADKQTHTHMRLVADAAQGQAVA